MLMLTLSAFVITGLAAAIPGPAIAWITALSAAQGTGRAMVSVAGVGAGTIAILLVSIFLLDGLNLTNSGIERAFRWVAIVVMVALAICLIAMSETTRPIINGRQGGFLGGFLLSVISPAHILVIMALLSEAARIGGTLPVSAAIIAGDTLPMIAAACGGRLLPWSAKLTMRVAAVVMLGFAGTSALGVV